MPASVANGPYRIENEAELSLAGTRACQQVLSYIQRPDDDRFEPDREPRRAEPDRVRGHRRQHVDPSLSHGNAQTADFSGLTLQDGERLFLS